MNNSRNSVINKILICENLFAKYLRFLVDFHGGGINFRQTPKNPATVKFRRISGIIKAP